MVQLDKDLLTWIKEKFYIKTEIESLLSNKSDTGHTHQSDTSLSTESMNPVANKVITNELNTKAPENHASTETKYGVATDTKYGHVKVDTALNTTSTSPVENRKIKAALDNKADSVHSHSSLSSTIISSNQNLNNYKTPGEYYCDSNSVAATLSNCPVTIAFHLSIIQHAGIRQILKTYATNNVRTYERNFYNNAWSTWYLTYTTETLNTDNGLMSTTEKNKLSRIADEATKNIVDTSLNTSSNNAISNKAVTTGLNGKAQTNHASTGTSYGLGSTNNYGHCKTINSLTQSSHADGTALSAYQGKILKDLIDTKSSGDHTHTGSTLRLGSSGSDANITIQDAVNGKSTLTHTHGSLTNGGALNSDITSVNKVAVTDSSNNLKTIAKVPWANLNISKTNITGLGIPASDTTYSAGTGLNLSSTTFSVKYGTAAGTACQGNDSRLSNARTPTSHAHGNLQNNGQVGSTAQPNKNVVTDSNGLITTENKIPAPTTTTLSFINTAMMSGTVKVTEKNGWATVYYENVKCTATHDSYTQFCKLPHSTAAKIYAEINFSNINNAIIFRVNEGYLEGRCIKANQGEYGNITFPIAGNN